MATLDTIARAYIRLAVGLGEHDPDSLDFYYGPAEWVADIRKAPQPLSEIRRSSLESVKALQTLPLHDALSETRRHFLMLQLQAIACRADLLAGMHRTVNEEAQCFFDVAASPSYDEKALASARKEIATLAGGRGTPAARLAAYEARFVVPKIRLRAVMERALEGCRIQTRRHMALPSDESVDLVFAGHEPWAGFSLYKGAHHSVVTINTDFPVTVDRALDLACHEGYPGHHTFNLTHDDALARQGTVEATVQPTYSPQSFLSEGAATIASDVAFTPLERARFERDELFPLAGLPATDVARYLKVEALVERLHPAVREIAREYLDGTLEFARASTALEEQALMQENFETLKYLNEFRSYVLTYTYAPDLLRDQLPRGESQEAVKRRWEMYTGWMRTESTPVHTVH